MRVSAKILRGFFYALGTGYVSRVVSIGLTFLIRRELGPSVFADVILGVTLFLMLSSLREFGLAHALLHFQEHLEEFVGTHFLLNMALTVASSILACACALILWVGWPETFTTSTTTVVVALSLLSVLRNLTLTSESMLRMDFEFGRLSLAHGIGTILALGAALTAARMGWRDWSLIVGGWSTYSVLSVVYVSVFSVSVWSWRPVELKTLVFSSLWARRLMRYGVWIWFGWILQTFVWWYDKLVVRLTIGHADLSLYENAWWLVQIPSAVITAIIFTYTNTLYSRFQDEPGRLSEMFGRIASLIVRVSGPFALILVANAESILTLMPGWAQSAPVVVWLAGYAFLRPLIDDGHGLLWAVGDTRTSAAVYTVQAAVASVVVPLGAITHGLNGVALAMGVVTATGVAGLVLGLRSHVTAPWLRILSGPCGALAIALIGLRLYMRLGIAPGLMDVIARVAVILSVYVAVLWLMERQQFLLLISQVRAILNKERQ